MDNVAQLGTLSLLELQPAFRESSQIVESLKIETQVTIVNQQGLHARPAAQFVRLAGQYPDCEVTVNKDGMAVNGKSIMGMMMLAAGPGSVLHILAEGEGAEELCQGLQQLVESGFGEPLADS